MQVFFEDNFIGKTGEARFCTAILAGAFASRTELRLRSKSKGIKEGMKSTILCSFVGLFIFICCGFIIHIIWKQSDAQTALTLAVNHTQSLGQWSLPISELFPEFERFQFVLMDLKQDTMVWGYTTNS